MPKALTEDKIRIRTEENGYKLIETYNRVYNSGKKTIMIKIQCHNNHERIIRIGELKQRCQECDIDVKIQTKIRERQGTFIEYIFKPNRGNKRRYVKFLCKNGHELILVSHDVGHRCKTCEILNITSDVKKIINDKDGTFINLFSKNNSRYVKFTCKKNHITTKPVHELKKGSWCKKCNESKYESAVRAIFKYIFNREFLPSYPKWQINPKTGRLLELDGYEPSLNLAFEYNGEQHYNFVKTYHKTIDKLRERQYKDAIKVLSCFHQKITLIVIPYTVKYLELYDYVVNTLDKKGIIRKEDFPEEINYKDLNINNKNELLIIQLEDILTNNNKKLVSTTDTIINVKSKIIIKCKNDHMWEGQIASLFKRPYYCKKC